VNVGEAGILEIKKKKKKDGFLFSILV